MDLNRVDFPEEFVRIAGEWHGGLSCILYAVSSTGGLTRGSHRPSLWDDDANDYVPASDERWICHLWDTLESTLSTLVRQVGSRSKGSRVGLRKLQTFLRWVRNTLADHAKASRIPGRKIADDRVKLVWRCRLCGKTHAVSPSFIEGSGTPLCECAEGSDDMTYVGVFLQ